MSIHRFDTYEYPQARYLWVSTGSISMRIYGRYLRVSTGGTLGYQYDPLSTSIEEEHVKEKENERKVYVYIYKESIITCV